MRTRRLPVVAGLAVALMAWLVAAPAPTEASGGRHPSDVATAGGYDYHTLMDADVIAGTPGNVVIRYVAGRAVSDGVLRIVVLRHAWPTDLRAEGPLYATTPAGAFSVRPGLVDSGVLTEPTRPSEAMCQPVPFGSWTVTDAPGAQVLTVRNVSCAAGQELDIRLEGVQAPGRPGAYAFPLLLTAAGGAPRVSVAKVRVVRPPRIQLEVTVPDVVGSDVPFLVLVTARNPNGQVATGYRGSVAVTDPGDCTLRPRGNGVVHTFTAADQGVTAFQAQLDIIATHQLHVYDVGRRALEGVSAPFEVAGPPPESIICPVSYH
jgi:hypothetical protein